MFKFDYKNAILLDKLRNGEYFISFLIWIHYNQVGGVNCPFRWTFSGLTYNTLYIQFFLYYFTVVCHCIHAIYNFKGKYAE